MSANTGEGLRLSAEQAIAQRPENSAPSRSPQRLAAARSSHAVVIESLLRQHRQWHPKADTQALLHAYEVAEQFHRGQERYSGDPYITHPLAVAEVLADLGMDTTALAAGLLHDTVEDTGYTLEQLRADFGGEVAHLVDGVTKIDGLQYQEHAEAETVRKLVVAMAQDPRVLVIKLADRLHNMRTLRFLPDAKQAKKAKETLEVLAPLAHRLGMNTLKWELEDLAFAALYPKRFDEIHRLVSEHVPARERALKQVEEEVVDDLRKANIEFDISARPKHLYSIYQKMIVRGKDFSDIYDLVGVRILVRSVRECYAALGVIHSKWQPVPGRFKDYIAMPKFNMYQSLHTTVIGPTGKPVEFQIRTDAMHRTAEYGIAAHWKYKDGKDGEVHVEGPLAKVDEMAWLRQLLDWQREASDPQEFMESLRFDLEGKELYVFTPKGDVISLPPASTPVDFAYAVHTDLGHRCIGARVNGKLVPLDSKLSNGDTVKVLISKSEERGPSRDWLASVKSARARTKIRQYFSRERREESVEKGKVALHRAVRKHRLPLQRILSRGSLVTIARDLHYKDVTSLYSAVGESHVSAEAVVQRLISSFGGSEGVADEIAESTPVTSRHATLYGSSDPSVIVKGSPELTGKLWVKLARCCLPVPGDEVLGFVTRGGVLSVHRRDCTNAENLRKKSGRIVDVELTPQAGSAFRVSLHVEAIDRYGLLSDISKVLTDEHLNIIEASVSTTRDRSAVSRFTFEMADPAHIAHILTSVHNVEGVYEVRRVGEPKEE